jgi:hypothetical protein
MSKVVTTPVGVWIVSAVMTLALSPSNATAQAQAQPAPGQQPQVTFAKDVMPILQRACQKCHRAGETAPMSLMTYQEVRPWARAIRTRVQAREMPPWHIDRTIGIQKFKDDPSLSDAEIRTITQWVDAGAPLGNDADMPASRQFANSGEWQIGKPDLVIRSTPHKVPAAAPDWFGSYVMPTGLKKDRYIKAIQTRPLNAASRKVVHHTSAAAIDVGDAAGGSGQFLVEYASGKGAEIYPEGTGVLMQAGKNVQIDFHIHSVGEEITAEVELGIVFYPEGYVPKHVRWVKQLGGANDAIDIPAGASDVRTDGYTRLNSAAVITAFQPHMHIRGKRQCLELIYPNGRSEVASCANFNYNWHLVYNYADDAAPIVPAGTLLHVISWYDNSPGNRVNPDPKNWVGFGNRTIDEMSFSWIGWYDLTESEYQERSASRRPTVGSN